MKKEKNNELSHEEKADYESLELEVTAFDAKDVIATSDLSDPDPDDYEMII